MISSSYDNADVFYVVRMISHSPVCQREHCNRKHVYDFKCSSLEEYNNRAIMNWELSQSMPTPLLRGQRCQPLSLLIVCVYVE